MEGGGLSDLTDMGSSALVEDVGFFLLGEAWGLYDLWEGCGVVRVHESSPSWILVGIRSDDLQDIDVLFLPG